MLDMLDGELLDESPRERALRREQQECVDCLWKIALAPNVNHGVENMLRTAERNIGSKRRVRVLSRSLNATCWTARVREIGVMRYGFDFPGDVCVDRKDHHLARLAIRGLARGSGAEAVSEVSYSSLHGRLRVPGLRATVGSATDEATGTARFGSSGAWPMKASCRYSDRARVAIGDSPCSESFGAPMK